MPDQPLATLRPLLKKLGYGVALDAAEQRAVLDLPHKAKTLPRHNYIVRERERTRHCCVLLSGFAIRHKIVAGGARQIVAIHMAGDVVDLQNALLGVADHSVQTITPSDVAFIPREAIASIALAYANVGMAMWLDTLVDGSIFREWIANVGRRDAHARIAHLLCEFSLRLKVAGLGEATEYELPMTQEQIADCTGLTSVHVNRTLKSLEAERLIERRTSRTIIIGDWRKLAEAGDFDSTYLHLRETDPALN
jgi:CRP-like cAMP-binding protein